uniref:Uncharacterized protein n=1 Tax=Panagrolaimus sp. JU765 TaxID=591449 RepID=A0AC34Q1N2_9BILA
MEFVGFFGESIKNNRVLYYESRRFPGHCYKFIWKRNDGEVKCYICYGCKKAKLLNPNNPPNRQIRVNGVNFVEDPERRQHFCQLFAKSEIQGEQALRIVGNQNVGSGKPGSDLMNHLNAYLAAKHGAESYSVRGQIRCKESSIKRRLKRKAVQNQPTGNIDKNCDQNLTKSIGN